MDGLRKQMVDILIFWNKVWWMMTSYVVLKESLNGFLRLIEIALTMKLNQIIDLFAQATQTRWSFNEW